MTALVEAFSTLLKTPDLLDIQVHWTNCVYDQCHDNSIQCKQSHGDLSGGHVDQELRGFSFFSVTVISLLRMIILPG